VADLGFNLAVFISQAVAFLILFGLLYIFGYKPILKMLDDRANRIKESLEQAEAVKEQSLQAQEEIKNQLQTANTQGQEIIARANRTSDEIRAKAQELVKTDADAMIERARQAISSERDEALNELRGEFANLTIMAAGKVIGESLDKESHKELIDKVLRESKTLNKG
jgi:F-type H+-transporting ATPase subunit b